MFRCFDDCGLLAWTSPCAVFGLNAREVGLYPCCCNKGCYLASSCLYFICFPLPSTIWRCWYIRPSIRRRYSIPGNCCKDCCTVLFCPHCALIQERQQLKEVMPSSSTNQVVVAQNPVTVAPQCYNPPQQHFPLGYSC